MKKTRMVLNNYIQDQEIKVDNEVIKCVQKYIYLGQKISESPNHEINQKNGQGIKCFYRQNYV